MPVLMTNRHVGESVTIGDWTIDIVDIKGRKVRLRIIAPADIKIVHKGSDPLRDDQDTGAPQ